MWNARMVVIPLKEEKYKALLDKEKKFKDSLPNWDDINPYPLYEIPSPITKPSGASNIYEVPAQTIYATSDLPTIPSLDLDKKFDEFKKEMEELYVKREKFEGFKEKVTAFKKGQSKISEDTAEQINDILTNQDTIVKYVQLLISTIKTIPKLPTKLLTDITIAEDKLFKLSKPLRKVSTGQPTTP